MTEEALQSAEVVEDYSWEKKKPTLPKAAATYPWEEWTNGSTYRVTAGVHFRAKPVSFKIMLAKEAKSRGLKVRTRVEGENKDTIVFQFYRPEVAE